MKTHSRTLTFVTCAVLSLGAFSSLHAQDATPRPRGGGGPGMLRGPAFDSLSQDEKDKLKAALEKAQQDPKVKEAREKAEAAAKEAREATNAALIAADPSVEPILKKLDEAREKARAGHGNGDQPKQ